MDKLITLNKANIASEHICCAFSDKKCNDGYQLKKDWLKKEFDNAYVFRRIDARAKVFMEYGSAEKAWSPILAPNYLFINCFWVSGQFQGKGYAKELLRLAENDAILQQKDGLVTIVGTNKFHFMSDTKWLLKNGFVACEITSTGFSLLVKKLNPKAENPTFNDSVKSGECESKNGLLVYYSNRCPFTEYYVNTVMKETAAKRNLPLTIIHLKTMEQAQLAPAPATIFSLFYNGKFITTNLSVCLDNRFDSVIEKSLK